MASDDDLKRLARLFADAFELGTRKAESDVGDEVCAHFGIALRTLEDNCRSAWRRGLSEAKQAELRQKVSDLLAESAKSLESLMSVVAQAGAKFLQIVGEIYELLSQSRATTR